MAVEPYETKIPFRVMEIHTCDVCGRESYEKFTLHMADPNLRPLVDKKLCGNCATTIRKVLQGI